MMMVLLSAIAATAEQKTALVISLTDGSKVQFLLHWQKPEVKFANGYLYEYDHHGNLVWQLDGEALVFQRDEVDKLTVEEVEAEGISVPQTDAAPASASTCPAMPWCTSADWPNRTACK